MDKNIESELQADQKRVLLNSRENFFSNLRNIFGTNVVLPNDYQNNYVSSTVLFSISNIPFSFHISGHNEMVYLNCLYIDEKFIRYEDKTCMRFRNEREEESFWKCFPYYPSNLDIEHVKKFLICNIDVLGTNTDLYNGKLVLSMFFDYSYHKMIGSADYKDMIKELTGRIKQFYIPIEDLDKLYFP